VDLALDGDGTEQVSSPVGSKIGSPVGFRLFFNPLTEAGKPTASIIHGLTVTFAWRRLPLPASENEKQPHPLRFFVVVLLRGAKEHTT
jgi:hypothetical protein